jgi:hypothetical protein
VIFGSRRALGGALIAPWVVVLLCMAPAGAIASETEPATSEAPTTDVTTLVLEPVCATDGLHRFAVNNTEGPDTQFIVATGDGAGGQTMAIDAGQTRHFWVEQPGSVEIAWADGSASATGVDVACAPDIAPPADPLSGPSATDTPRPTPRPSASPSPQPTSEASAPTTPEAGQPAPAAPAGRRPRPAAPEPATDSQPTGSLGDDDPSAGDPAVRHPQTEPRPRLLDGTMVCPDGWIPIDGDADGRFEASDTCEVLVETAAQASPVGAAFPTIALIVTIGLLVASMGWGAFRRQRV